jgi:hypothetical protein
MVEFERVASVSGSGTFQELGGQGFVTASFTNLASNATNATGFTQSSSTSLVSPGISTTTTVQSATGYNNTATANVVTSTIQTYTIEANVTSSSTSAGSAWTTRLNAESSTVTEFVSTPTQQTQYFVQSVSTATSSRLTTSQLSETTEGNVVDTIWLAEDTEVLWVVNKDPAWSAPITDNAQSTMETTISASAEVLGLSLVEPSETSSVASSQSTGTISWVNASQTTVTRTGVFAKFRSPGETTELTFSASTSGDTSEANILQSSQPFVFHRGNTSTVTTFVRFATTRSLTDVMASATWNEFLFVTLGTASAVQSFDVVVTSSTVSGSTTRLVPVLGGQTAIASQARMSVYASNGVAIGENKGMRFTGGGFAGLPVDDDDDVVGPLGPRTAQDGSSIYLATIFPITQGNEFGLNAVTQESNSVTFVSTTSASDATTTITTTSSVTVGVADPMWIAPVRSRANVLGGDLAPGETALMRIGRGLYEDQSGSTSFFEGNDTTYTGSMPTTYWLPVTYLTPAFEQTVFSVLRNTGTWPTA